MGPTGGCSFETTVKISQILELGNCEICDKFPSSVLFTSAEIRLSTVAGPDGQHSTWAAFVSLHNDKISPQDSGPEIAV